MKIGSWLVPLALLAGGASAQSTVGVVGTPPHGSTVSGVSAVSGYHCTSKDIEVFIDGQSVGKAGSGTQLLGTLDVCGRTDTGYSLLFNFSNLDNGVHNITVTADGVPLATNTVTTVKSGGVQWLTGASKQIKVSDFPLAGQQANLQWVQSYQNFLVTGIGDTAGDLTGLNGTYVQELSISVSGISCYLYNFLTGTERFTIATGALVTDPSSTLLSTFPMEGGSGCTYVLTTYAGNSATGYDLNGNATCEAIRAGSYPGLAKGLRRSADGLRLLGTIETLFPGCTHTAVLY